MTMITTRAFPIPLYLNQGFVFDILATMEDGFSQLTTMKTTSKEQQNRSHEVSGEIGASNVFAFLGLKFGGKSNSQVGNDASQEASAEKVHTPNSLFAKMRGRLIDDDVIMSLDKMENLTTGSFVEFKTVLNGNPLLEAFEYFLSVIKMAIAFQEPAQSKISVPQSKNQKSSVPQSKSQMDQIIDQLELVDQNLRGGGTIDLVGTSHTSGISAVLTLDQSFVREETLSNLIDGEFTVLGKVVRIVRANDDAISLLRKTSFGKLSNSALKTLFESLSSAFSGLSEAGLKIRDLNTEVNGPAIQVLPIAIYA